MNGMAWLCQDELYFFHWTVVSIGGVNKNVTKRVNEYQLISYFECAIHFSYFMCTILFPIFFYMFLYVHTYLLFGDIILLFLLLGCGNSLCDSLSWYGVSDSFTDHSYSIFVLVLVSFLFFFLSFINTILVYVCQFSAIKLQ